jgi:uncharacterized protein
MKTARILVITKQCLAAAILFLALLPSAAISGATSTVDEELRQARIDWELLEAAKSGDFTLVKKVLAKGARVDAKDEKGGTALVRAAGEGHFEVANLLIEQGADVNAKDKYGLTALRQAARRGDLKLVILLLDRGADVGAGTGKTTALIEAACHDGLEVTRVLLDKGADLNSRAYFGQTALSCAARRGKKDLVKLLLDRGATPTLGDAVVLGDIEAVERLIKDGVNVNGSYGPVGQKALLEAAERGSLGIAKLLLEKGADVNARSGLPGRTALMEAAKRNHLEVSKLLLAMGADVNMPEGKQGPGYTALMFAASEGNLEVVKLLIQKGADVKAKGEHGMTALNLAQEGSHTDVIRYLKAYEGP